MASDQRILPTEITLHRAARQLEISFADGARFLLDAEYLRVYSPSAEVVGHSPREAVLQTGKRHVAIVAVEPVGHYALKIRFSDGHDTGLYTWAYLRRLGEEHDALWADYLARLAAANASRDPHSSSLEK